MNWRRLYSSSSAWVNVPGWLTILSSYKEKKRKLNEIKWKFNYLHSFCLLHKLHLIDILSKFSLFWMANDAFLFCFGRGCDGLHLQFNSAYCPCADSNNLCFRQCLRDFLFFSFYVTFYCASDSNEAPKKSQHCFFFLIKEIY